MINPLYIVYLFIIYFLILLSCSCLLSYYLLNSNYLLCCSIKIPRNRRNPLRRLKEALMSQFNIELNQKYKKTQNKQINKSYLCKLIVSQNFNRAQVRYLSWVCIAIIFKLSCYVCIVSFFFTLI